MTILEKRSATRVKALRNLVDKGEYPVEYAIGKLDELNEKGLVTAKDYEETFDYFDEILNKPVEEIIEEPIEEIAQNNEEMDTNNIEENTKDESEVIE